MEKIAQQKLVWVDTDITIGAKKDIFSYCDVDDCYALVALLRSEQVDVTGISTTLGNTDNISVSTGIAKKFIKNFGPNSTSVFRGCDKKLGEDLTDVTTNEAVEELARTLQSTRLTILCVGCATNIAILLLKYPELQSRIDEVVLVAGRRSFDSHFISGKWQLKPFRDLNFEYDPKAFEILLNSELQVTLVPFEACDDFWIRPHDLERIERANEVGKYMAKHSVGWLTEWALAFGADGFNPFDLVAAGYLIRPELFTIYDWQTKVELGKDDTDHRKIKPYLLCNEDIQDGRNIRYCTAFQPELKKYLLDRICTHDMAAFVLGTSHVNVIVPDVDEAEEYYGRVLGFSQAYDENGDKMDYANVEMESFAIDAGIPDGKVCVDVRFLKHPQAQLYLELMTYHKPKGSPEIPNQPKTYDMGGPRHIALEVSNCNETFKYLQEQEGVTMINPSEKYHPVKLDGFPISFFYWIDRYGVQWEMEEGRRVGTSRSIV